MTTLLRQRLAELKRLEALELKEQALKAAEMEDDLEGAPIAPSKPIKEAGEDEVKTEKKKKKKKAAADAGPSALASFDQGEDDDVVFR